MIKYSRVPTNCKNEIHVCFRCSDEHSIFLPVCLYSVLSSNVESYVYIYVFTDKIALARKKKIISCVERFSNVELFFVEPTQEDVAFLMSRSRPHRGWGLVHLSIFYQRYLPLVDAVFNFGTDSFCVGDLRIITSFLNERDHIYGSGSSHQKERRARSANANWMGLDASLISLKNLRRDGISPEALAERSLKEVGYVHDEVAYNLSCSLRYLEARFYYILTGTFRPNRKMHSDTRIVDFYSILKPWNASVPGYEVFELYRCYHSRVSEFVDLEYCLPHTLSDVSRRLYMAGHRLYSLPIRLPYFGKTFYYVIVAFDRLTSKLRYLSNRN